MTCCPICNSGSRVIDIYGYPTYPICADCYEGAKDIIKLINKLETENENINASTSTHSPTGWCKSLSNASKWVVGLTEKLSFLQGLVDVYRNRTPADILLKPSNNGSPIVAHRDLLAARSKIFKNMLESDTCKAPPLEAITLSLNHEELEALLDFLYRGSMSRQKLEKYIYPLSLAAHKYEIIYLQKFCQDYMLETLDSCNALMVLEISDFCSFLTVRDHTMSFIVKHVEDIVFSAEYEAFTVKNPHLSVQITRTLSKNPRNNW